MGRQLGIEFVFIPPYSPTLNAIEPLWKDLKRDISPIIFDGKDHFREVVTETFLRLSHRLSQSAPITKAFHRKPGDEALKINLKTAL